VNAIGIVLFAASSTWLLIDYLKLGYLVCLDVILLGVIVALYGIHEGLAVHVDTAAKLTVAENMYILMGLCNFLTGSVVMPIMIKMVSEADVLWNYLKVYQILAGSSAALFIISGLISIHNSYLLSKLVCKAKNIGAV